MSYIHGCDESMIKGFLGMYISIVSMFETIIIRDLRNDSAIDLTLNEYQVVKNFSTITQISPRLDYFIDTMIGLYRRSILGFDTEIKYYACVNMFETLRLGYKINELFFNKLIFIGKCLENYIQI
jgi:hypothetical protein